MFHPVTNRDVDLCSATCLPRLFLVIILSYTLHISVVSLPLFPFPAGQPKSRHLIDKLVATTDGVIIAHSRSTSGPSDLQRTQPRSSPGSLAWSVSQRASRDINVQAAIECVTSTLELIFKFSHCTTELDEAVSRVFPLDQSQFSKVAHPHRILASALVQ